MSDREEHWFTGPAGDRFRYWVASPTPLPGGQGFVFEATRHTDVVIPVALKLLGGVDPVVEESLRSRWARVEAKPNEHLANPIEVFRGPGLFTGEPPADEDSDLLYGATRWIPGASLRASAPLTPTAVANMARDLSQALTHLHEECGLIHRDVHPGNVIVGPDGGATLIDLGAARPDDGTVTTTVAGVLGFIPPERTSGPGDRRSDAWAFGMVVVYALLGHPAGGQSMAQLVEELDQTLPTKADRRRVSNLLERIVASDPALRPADLVRWAEELAEALRPTARRRRAVRVLVGATAVAVAVAVATLGATAFASRDGVKQAPSTRSTLSSEVGTNAAMARCDHALGAPDPALSPADSAQVSDAVPALRAAAGHGCGQEPASLFGEAVYQLILEGTEPHVIIVAPNATVMLTPTEWVSYREIAGRQRAENAITFGGYPTATGTDDVVGTQVELSQGGLLLGRRDDTQSFWMPAPVLALWRARGGVDSDLGYPMTNPFVVPDGLRQDFEGGHLELPAEASIPLAAVDPGMLVLHLAEDPGAILRGLDLGGHLIRQPTGTAWWIDDRGRRRWIADGPTYVCMGGDEAVAANDLSGASVATVPLGPPATCDG